MGTGNVLGSYVRFPFFPTGAPGPAAVVRRSNARPSQIGRVSQYLGVVNKSNHMRAGNKLSVMSESSDSGTQHVCVTEKISPSGHLARLGRKHAPTTSAQGEMHLRDHRTGCVRMETNANIFVLD